MADTNATDRRERANALTTSALEGLLTAIEQGGSPALKAYLDVASRFHRYSFRNQLLIARQYPTATRVAGFHAWHDLGRHVRKGEKGIAILAPMVGKDKDAVVPAGGSAPTRVFGFRVVYVFDVAQTDGADLPEHPVIHAEGGSHDVFLRLCDYATSHGIGVAQNVAASDMAEPGAYGDTNGERIRLSSLIAGDIGALIGTLAHELGHALLHFPGKPLDCLAADAGRPTDRELRELEAEAVAYVIASAAGCTHVDRMADYITGWNGSRERLEASLGRIQKACAVLFGALEADPTQEQEKAA